MMGYVPTWLTSRLSGWTQLVLDVVTRINGHSSSAAPDLHEGSTSLELGVVELWVFALVNVGAIFTVGERTVIEPSTVI